MNYADFQFLKFDPKPNGTMLITLNRADAMNATNARMHWELTKVWDVVNHDPGPRDRGDGGWRPRLLCGRRSVLDRGDRRQPRQGR